jgi:hypothetical protein
MIGRTAALGDYARNNTVGVALICSIFLVAAFWWLSPAPGSQGLRTDMINGNYSAAYARLIKSAQTGDAEAQNGVGNMYYLGLGVDQDFAKARQWYFKAALNGNSAAASNAGHMYSQGLGVPKDIMRSYAWFVHATKMGSKDADNYLREILGGFEVVPNMMERAMERYPDVKALTR